MLSALTVTYVAAFYSITLVSNQGDTKEDRDQIRISLNRDRYIDMSFLTLKWPNTMIWYILLNCSHHMSRTIIVWDMW